MRWPATEPRDGLNKPRHPRKGGNAGAPSTCAKGLGASTCGILVEAGTGDRFDGLARGCGPGLAEWRPWGERRQAAGTHGCSETFGMKAAFRFTYEPHWHHAPLAFWVHVPVPGAAGAWEPPAPRAVAHRGYALLRIEYGSHELLFSALAQLDHFIEVLAAKPLPTSRRLSARRGTSAGPNGHWLSRLPAELKSPRTRERLIRELRVIRAEVAQQWPGDGNGDGNGNAAGKA